MSEKIVLFDIDYTLFDTNLFKESKLLKHKIYDEVEEVLEKLSKIAILGIFSEGEIFFQNNKLSKTNIKKFFEKKHIHVVSNKEENIREVFNKYKHSKVFFVEDKLSVLKLVKQLYPSVITIWVKRGMYAENQEDIGFTPDITTQNIRGVYTIVKEE